MTDREKVIKGLECCMSEKLCNSPCPYRGQCDDGGYYFSKAIEDAIDLLKAQEPIEPIRTDEEWQCGNCKEPVGWDELQVFGIAGIKNVYCSNCGRKVKWE